jgi:hypothetical protein
MPLVPFSVLPDMGRVWVFASERELDAAGEQRLLQVVDEFLEQWAAHGAPLTSGREIREHRFLTIGVDQSGAAASGCSIDGLYRSLRSLQSELGSSLLGGGLVYYRDAAGEIQCITRDEFADLAAKGAITSETPVFDTSVTTVGEWYGRFEAQAGRAWHRALLPTG